MLISNSALRDTSRLKADKVIKQATLQQTNQRKCIFYLFEKTTWKTEDSRQQNSGLSKSLLGLNAWVNLKRYMSTHLVFDMPQKHNMSHKITMMPQNRIDSILECRTRLRWPKPFGSHSTSLEGAKRKLRRERKSWQLSSDLLSVRTHCCEIT